MIKIIEGDILSSKTDIIAHQVNCRGAFNSGVAKAIREYDYGVYQDYFTFCKEHTPASLLGTVRYFQSNIDARIYASLFAQDAYGYGRQYTDINALKSCFKDLKLTVDIYDDTYHKKLSVALPYKIGCVRGGASWNEVYPIIEDMFKDYDVELWRLNKG